MEKLLTVLLMFSALAFGQQAKAPTKTPTDKRLPISHYMQKMGLLYLEHIHDMLGQADQDYATFKRDPVNNELIGPADNVYGKALTSLEENIEIDIKLPGDKALLDMLENTKSYATIAFYETLRTSDPAHKRPPMNPERAKMYPVCLGQAMGIIKVGVFIEGDCSLKNMQEARKADEALQKRQSEANP